MLLLSLHAADDIISQKHCN